MQRWRGNAFRQIRRLLRGTIRLVEDLEDQCRRHGRFEPGLVAADSAPHVAWTSVAGRSRAGTRPLCIASGSVG